MKHLQIKYQNLGRNLSGVFDIVSNKGNTYPNEVVSSDLLNGVVIDLPEEASEIYILPKVYNFITNGTYLSGLKFYKTNQNLNSNPVYLDNTNNYALWRTSGLNQKDWVITELDKVGVQSSGYYKISSSFNYDIDAKNYFDAVESLENSSLDICFKLAVDEFVKSLKIYGLWDNISGCGILFGANTLSGALIPLKGTTPINYGFTNSDYSKESGLKGNAVNKYLDLRIKQSDLTRTYSSTVDYRFSSYIYVSQPTTGGFYLSAGSGDVSGSSAIKASGSSILYKSANNNYISMGSLSDSTGLLGIERNNDFNWRAIKNTLQTGIFGTGFNLQRNVQLPLYSGTFKLFRDDSTSSFSNGRINFYINTYGVSSSLRNSINHLINNIKNSTCTTNIPGLFSGSGVSGNFNLNDFQNNTFKIINTPGKSEFSGFYRSGIYFNDDPAGTPPEYPFSPYGAFGYKNNTNGNFYIFNDTYWKAVEHNTGTNTLFIWYTNKSNLSNSIPPTTGWVLESGLDKKYNPAPVFHYGNCIGDTLLYRDYIFETSSFDSSTDKLKFYSGGIINNDGSSDVFPSGIKVKDLFPDIQINTLVNSFYYTDYINNNRYFLLRSLENWLICDLLGNYNNSGFYYWSSNKFSFLYESGNDTLSSATGLYVKIGTTFTGEEYLSLKINPFVDVNKSFYKNTNLDLSNYSGLIYLGQNSKQESSVSYKFIQTELAIPGASKIRNSKDNTKIVTGRYDANNIFSGNFYTGFITTKTDAALNVPSHYIELDKGAIVDIEINGSGSNNLIQWFSAPTIDGPYSNFNLQTVYYRRYATNTNHANPGALTGKAEIKDNFPNYTVGQFTGALFSNHKFLIISGSQTGTSGYMQIIVNPKNGYLSGTVNKRDVSIKNFDGFYNVRKILTSGQYSGLQCLIGNKYTLATPEFQVSGAKSLSSGTSIWSILDFDSTYINWRNFESDPSKAPFKYWVSGSGIFDNILDLKYIPLYSYNNYSNNNLNIDTGYNYNLISGIFGLQSGQTFVLNFFNDPTLTGVILVTETKDPLYFIVTGAGTTYLNGEYTNIGVRDNLTEDGLSPITKSIFYSEIDGYKKYLRYVNLTGIGAAIPGFWKLSQGDIVQNPFNNSNYNEILQMSLPDEYYYLNGNFESNQIATGNWQVPGPGGDALPPVPTFIPSGKQINIYGNLINKKSFIYGTQTHNMNGDLITDFNVIDYSKKIVYDIEQSGNINKTQLTKNILGESKL